MSKYNIGEKVRVRAVLANFAYDNIGGYYATSDMCKYAGEIAKVISLYTFADGHSTYLLDTLDETPVGAPRRCYWTDDMLEPVDNVRGAKINEINADKAAKAMSELGKNLVIYSKNDKAATAMPQSVSEYISAMKDIHVSLYEAMGWHMAPKWLKRNSEEFARAWLYGYKIEEEEK